MSNCLHKTAACRAVGVDPARYGADPSRAQSALPNEIVELARALKGDPDLIYEYVHNNIQTMPMFGSIKGPLGALIDGEGTPFDQAELMVLLLRQSGYTANFVVGPIQLPQVKLAAWFGTDDLYWSLFRVISYGFRNFGHVNPVEEPPVHVHSADLWWAWVQVNIGGTNYVFDPSTKDWARTTGIGRAALAAGANYSRSAFIAGAESGAQINSTNLIGLNRDSVRSSLATYANNLVQYLRTNHASATTKDIVGGPSITPLPLGMQQRITSLPYENGPNTIYSDISQFRTLLTQQFGWNDANNNFTALSSLLTLNSSDVYGRRMTVVSSPSAAPTLLLDGVAQLVGSAVPSGRELTVRVSTSYPWTSIQYDFPGVLNNDATRIQPGTQAHAIVPCWGRTGRGMIEKHRRTLQEGIVNSGNPESEPILGESLSIIGYTYCAEHALRRSIVGELLGLVDLDLHLIGTFGMGTHGSVTGPFISIWVLQYVSFQRANRHSSFDPTPLEVIANSANASWGSVVESAALEQTQPGASAVSTVKLIDAAVQQGVRIWDINNKDVPGNDKTYYQQTIRPLLALPQNGWNQSDLGAIDRLVCISVQTCIQDPPADGYRIIAPQSGLMPSTNLPEQSGTL